MSRTRLVSAVSLSLLLFALACNESKQDAAKKAAPSETKSAEGGEPAATSTTSGTSTSTSTTSGAASGAGESESESDEDTEDEPAPAIPDHFDEIGVAVCDQYVKDYLACIDTKIAEAERETHRRTLADNHASWTQTMKGGESAAAGLAIGCRAAREQARSATTNAGCTW